MASRAARPVPASSGSAAKRACRRVAAASFCVSAGLFLFSPVSALWTLADAVRGNDVVALRDGADWGALRASLKDAFLQPAPSVAATPVAGVRLASARVPVSAAAPAPVSDDELPEFGSSFVSTVVSNAVDDDVTPERLLALAHPAASGTAGPVSVPDALHRLAGFGFDAPDRFEVALRISDQPNAEPVRLVLRIERWRWKVIAVHMPASPAEPAADLTRRT